MERNARRALGHARRVARMTANAVRGYPPLDCSRRSNSAAMSEEPPPACNISARRCMASPPAGAESSSGLKRDTNSCCSYANPDSSFGADCAPLAACATPVMFPEISMPPAAARVMLSDISLVVAVCSSTAVAMIA